MAWTPNDVFVCITRPPREGPLEASRVIRGRGETLRKKSTS